MVEVFIEYAFREVQRLVQGKFKLEALLIKLSAYVSHTLLLLLK